MADGNANVRLTLVADTDTEITFASPGIQHISFAIITASVTNPVFVKPRSALTGVDAAAWQNDLSAFKLTSAVRTVDFYYQAPVTSIHVGSASAEELQWSIYTK